MAIRRPIFLIAVGAVGFCLVLLVLSRSSSTVAAGDAQYDTRSLIGRLAAEWSVASARDGITRPSALSNNAVPGDVPLPPMARQLSAPSLGDAVRRYADSPLPTVAVFLGTRPEAIKLAPLVAEMLAPHNAAVYNTAVVSTGQHREMLQQMFDSFQLSVDVELSLMVPDQTPADLMARALSVVSQVLAEMRPALVLVQGDTATALVCAMAAFFLRIPVGHVEAGLRSFDMDNPFPEEFCRRAIDVLAAFHFAPTEYAAEALRRENICGREIHVTGNTGVDAILHALSKPMPPAARGIVDRIGRVDGGVVMLVTSHRRENLGAPLASICRAVRRIVQENAKVSVVFPVHLNPNVRKVVHSLLRGVERVLLLDPLPYDVLPYVMQHADVVMTDSGGIQEEAVSIGKPVILLRRTTERPEGVFVGTVRISGTDENELLERTRGAITRIAEIRRTLQAAKVFGHGNASQITANIVRGFLQRPPEDRARVVEGCTEEKQNSIARAVFGYDALRQSTGAGDWGADKDQKPAAAENAHGTSVDDAENGEKVVRGAPDANGGLDASAVPRKAPWGVGVSKPDTGGWQAGKSGASLINSDDDGELSAVANMGDV